VMPGGPLYWVWLPSGPTAVTARGLSCLWVDDCRWILREVKGLETA
jgi:hypothetical protein